jgi:ethanolamine utilization protein EutN
MLLGKVIGTVVVCVVYEGLDNWPMLLVQPLDKQRHHEGTPIVCADSTRMAGPGELIYFEGGREAAMVLEPWFVPVDHTIVGIVDQLSIDGELVAEPKAGGGAKTAKGRKADKPKKPSAKKPSAKKPSANKGGSKKAVKKASKRGGAR